MLGNEYLLKNNHLSLTDESVIFKQIVQTNEFRCLGEEIMAALIKSVPIKESSY